MKKDASLNIQSKIFDHVRKAIGPEESIGLVLSDVLALSTDAVYRRIRNETPMTIHEVEKVCSFFKISFDSLSTETSRKVDFDYLDSPSGEFSMDIYLRGILSGMKDLRKLPQVKLFLTVNNVHFFQAFNFPEIVHFRLFFWAKSHLLLPEYEHRKFDINGIIKEAFNDGREILQLYNQLETVEIVDREMMRGYLRQIAYAWESGWFKDAEQVLRLIDAVEEWLNHFLKQAENGKKFQVGTAVPASGAKLNLFLNDTVNTDTTFYYECESKRGVYLIHNILNYLHTNNDRYVGDTKAVIDRQLLNANLISEVNHKDRHKYFQDLFASVNAARLEIITKR
jgi:hypothetical protein